MKFEVVAYLAAIIVIFLVDSSVACKNQTRIKRQDGPDFAGMAAAVIGQGMEAMTQGAGVKNDFKVKFGNKIWKIANKIDRIIIYCQMICDKGNAEMQHNTGAGVGEAFKSMNKGEGEGEGSRRKRSPSSFFQPENLIKTESLKSVFRGKRQAAEENPDTMFEQIKRTFSGIIDTTKEMFQKVKESFAASQNKQPTNNLQWLFLSNEFSIFCLFVLCLFSLFYVVVE